jgi:hypothetical protein
MFVFIFQKYFFKKLLHSKAPIRDVEIRKTIVGFLIKMTKIIGVKEQ